MHPKVRMTVEALTQSLLLPIVVIAAAVFFVNQVAPERAAPIMQRLVPLFVVVICIQGALTFSVLGKTREQLSRVLTEAQARPMLAVRAFSNAADFHAYISELFDQATEVRVTHVSSGTTELLTDEYIKIMDAFIKRGGIYRRIFCNTKSVDVWSTQQAMLDKYSDTPQQFMLHYLANLNVDDMQGVDLMLIDDKEVCLGGGYKQGFAFPVIAIREPAVVRFFSNYYAYLLTKARGIRVDPFADRGFIADMLKRAEEVASRTPGVPTGGDS